MRPKISHRLGALLLLAFALIGKPWPGRPCLGQIVGYNHPELKWLTIETPHFFVHYHEGAERTAREIARIAEQIYKPVTSLYLYEPNGKVHFIVRDHDDFSNGVAYYYDNKIEIWATPMDFELRGTHPWLLNVVTHEFTHIVSLQVSQKFGRRIPAFYLQLLGYEREKRPDVLYGFPNRILSFPLAGTTIPVWFAEGVAQYQTPDIAHDFWDSHRDMILRMAVLEDRMLDFSEMGVFGRNSLENEMAYNHGFALVNYLVNKYGEKALRQILKKMQAPWRLSFDQALRAVLGMGGKELYEQWVSHLKKVYRDGVRRISKNLVQGEIIESKGIGNFFPVWSPDGQKIAYLSNKGSDYLHQTSLWLYDLRKKKARLLRGGIESSISWSPKGDAIAYARKRRVNRYGSHYFDLFVYRLDKKKEQALTQGYRARSPDWSPDGKKLVFIFTRDGTDNLAIYDFKTGKIRPITRFKDGTQIFRPRWSPNGRLIVFSLSKGGKHGRNLATIRPDGSRFKYLLRTSGDARDPVFSPSGKRVYFSWDKGGIFNIYRINLRTKKIEPVTNVLGGAFMPDIHRSGKLVYSLYTADGYKIALIRRVKRVKAASYLAYNKLPRSRQWYQRKSKAASRKGGGLPSGRASPGRAGDKSGSSKSAQELKAQPYRNHYTPIAFLPRVMSDYGTLKLGTYFYSSDVLNQYEIFGGVALNRQLDYDVFGLIYYRKHWPTFFMEVYNQVRHTKEGDVQYRYNLLEANVGLELKLSDYLTLRGSFIFSHYSGRMTTYILGLKNSFGYTYFIGRDFSSLWRYRRVKTAPDDKINPSSGREVLFRYDRQLNKFIRGFKIHSTYGTIVEDYAPYNYNQFYLEWREYRSLPWKHTLEFRLRGGYIDRPVEGFFHFFAGGLVGLKGYPYYSIEGEKMASVTLIYRFPLSRHLDIQIAPFYLDKLFVGIFGEYGNAWSEARIPWRDFKRDAGLQIRLDLIAFYSYPMKLFWDVAYGFNRFQHRGQSYGQEFRFYFGLAFAYLD